MTAGYLLGLWLEVIAPVTKPRLVAGLRIAVGELGQLLGDVDLGELDRDELEALWLRRTEAGDGLRVHLWHWCLVEALDVGVALGLVDRNVAVHVPAP